MSWTGSPASILHKWCIDLDQLIPVRAAIHRKRPGSAVVEVEGVGLHLRISDAPPQPLLRRRRRLLRRLRRRLWRRLLRRCRRRRLLRRLGLVPGQERLGSPARVALRVRFGAALATNASLASLNMRFNRIGFGGARAMAFARALETNASLAWLDMAQNELSELGARAFASALSSNRALTHLDLQRNEMGAEGGAAVAEALAANDTLTSLDASSNDIGAAGAVAFGAALKSNRTLAALNLAQNGIGTDGAIGLADGLADDPSTVGGQATIRVSPTPLRALNLDRNHLGPGGASRLAAALLLFARAVQRDDQHRRLRLPSHDALHLVEPSSPAPLLREVDNAVRVASTRLLVRLLDDLLQHPDARRVDLAPVVERRHIGPQTHVIVNGGRPVALGLRNPSQRQRRHASPSVQHHASHL